MTCTCVRVHDYIIVYVHNIIKVYMYMYVQKQAVKLNLHEKVTTL